MLNDGVCLSITMITSVCKFDFDADASINIRANQSRWGAFFGRRFVDFWRESSDRFRCDSNFEFKLLTIDSTVTFRCRGLFEADTLRLTSDFETTRVFVRLTSKTGSDDSDFVGVIEKLAVRFSMLTNFSATPVTMSIDFGDSDFDDAVKKLSIDDLTSTNFVMFEVTTINIMSAENCSLSDVINNDFRRWRIISLMFWSNLLTAARKINLLIIQSTGQKKLSTEIDRERARTPHIEIFFCRSSLLKRWILLTSKWITDRISSETRTAEKRPISINFYNW